MRIRRASRALAAAAAAAIVAAVVAVGCDALPDEQLLRFLGFRKVGATTNLTVLNGDLLDKSTDTVDAAFQNETFTAGRGDDPGTGIMITKARMEYKLQGTSPPSYEYPVTLFLPAPAKQGETTEGTLSELPLVPEQLKQWIRGSGVPIHPFVQLTAHVTFSARTDDGNDLKVEGVIPVVLNDSGGSGALPTVFIEATTPTADESNPTSGVFTVTREGSTTGALPVSYSIGGSAKGGEDYTALSGRVTIDAGRSTATVTVTPVDDGVTESPETVILTLSAGADYDVGSPASATVTIQD